MAASSTSFQRQLGKPTDQVICRLGAGPATNRDLCDALNVMSIDLSMLLARLRRKGEIKILDPANPKTATHLHGAPVGTRIYALSSHVE